jgi:predicted anti-sigma-YlaC factor YlaD
VSIALDEGLSEFERALLDGHLATCPPCSSFQTSVAGFTTRLRSEPLENVELPFASRRRRRSFARLAPAAAFVLTAVGVAGILTSGQLKNFSGRSSAQPASTASVQPSATNLVLLGGQRRAAQLHQRMTRRVPRGPVGR